MGMAAAMVKGEADAISMWEPESENAVHAIGKDAIISRTTRCTASCPRVFDDRRDERSAAAEGACSRSCARHSLPRRTCRRIPPRYFPLISQMTKHPQDEIARSWEHHDFPLGVAPDLLDLITEEEKWVAAQQKRTPRSRAQLAGFIDTTILKEAQALNAKR